MFLKAGASQVILFLGMGSIAAPQEAVERTLYYCLPPAQRFAAMEDLPSRSNPVL
jgi:hypothetical protein